MRTSKYSTISGNLSLRMNGFLKRGESSVQAQHTSEGEKLVHGLRRVMESECRIINMVQLEILQPVEQVCEDLRCDREPGVLSPNTLSGMSGKGPMRYHR